MLRPTRDYLGNDVEDSIIMRSLGRSIKQETYVEVSGLFLLSVSKWSIRLDILRTVDEGCRELYSNEILGTEVSNKKLM